MNQVTKQQLPKSWIGKLAWVVKTIVTSPVWLLFKMDAYNKGKENEVVSFRTFHYRNVNHKCVYDKSKPVHDRFYTYYRCEFEGCNIIHPLMPNETEIQPDKRFTII